MAQRKWSEVVNLAIKAYRSKEYVYLYGAKNVRLTSEAQIREYFKREPAYFAKYSEEEKNQIIRNSLGKIAADCSGFVGWVCTGDKQYSIGQINNCSKYNTLQAGPTGSILFTTWGGTGRHIGLDVGNGLCMHIGWESTDKAIAEGRAGILFEPITARAWEKSGESRVVNYKGSYSPYNPTTLLWNKVNPSPEPVPMSGWVGEVYGKNLINVYEAPSTTAALLTDYPHLGLGNLFEVTMESIPNEMWKVKIANEYEGWIEKRYCLRKTEIKEGTTTSNLHLRTNPGTKYKSIAIMPKNTKVKICDTKKAKDGVDWYYVIYDGIYGFASCGYIK